MITRLAHVCLHATDLAATEAFWCGVLGLQRTFTFERDGHLFGFYLGLGERSFIEVFSGEPGAGEGAIRHLCLEVPDIQAVHAALQAAGLAEAEPMLGCDQSWQCWATDPNGVRIEFHQYTAASCQLTGAVCHVDW